MIRHFEVLPRQKGGEVKNVLAALNEGTKCVEVVLTRVLDDLCMLNLGWGGGAGSKSFHPGIRLYRKQSQQGVQTLSDPISHFLTTLLV